MHLPTSSLQLIYSMTLQLPESLRSLSLLHADEYLDEDSGELIARLDTQRPELFLAEYRDGMPTGELFCLQQGELIAQPTKDQLLSEAFAPRQGWLVAASNCPLRS